jgi:Thiamine monophosphate kinase
MSKQNEFDVIARYFTPTRCYHPEVTVGVGDDAAVLQLDAAKELSVSTDTLVSGVHFLSSWAPEDIAFKTLMVNFSDCAAMAAEPIAVTLALTVPQIDPEWMKGFSSGLHQGLKAYQVDLIGGDLTRGPLTVTCTVLANVTTGHIGFYVVVRSRVTLFM